VTIKIIIRRHKKILCVNINYFSTGVDPCAKRVLHYRESRFFFIPTESSLASKIISVRNIYSCLRSKLYNIRM
jgi:hypothetical protein